MSFFSENDKILQNWKNNNIYEQIINQLQISQHFVLLNIY